MYSISHVTEIKIYLPLLTTVQSQHTAGGLIGSLPEALCEVNPFLKHVLLAMQWKILIIMWAFTLFNTTGQDLLRNNKLSIVIKCTLSEVTAWERVNSPPVSLSFSHTSRTLSKYSWQNFWGYFIGQKPTLEQKRIVFLVPNIIHSLFHRPQGHNVPVMCMDIIAQTQRYH